MQKRTESNIRDKRLVKMVKLQVKTETKRIAEMLNEMNPKLKALLAAGLIGTAGLGMQSCSNPSDSVYYPYTVEAPSTDNPGSGGAETSNPSGGEENGGNGRETVNKNEVTFEKLYVTNQNDKDRLRNVMPMTRLNGLDLLDGVENHVYIGKEPGFEVMSKLPDDTIQSLYANGDLPYFYSSSEEGRHIYHIPANMIDKFIAAGAKL